jgi:hypothetical protein
MSYPALIAITALSAVLCRSDSGCATQLATIERLEGELEVARQAAAACTQESASSKKTPSVAGQTNSFEPADASAMKKAGAAVWGNARLAMLASGKAILVHSNPDIFVVPDFLSSDEADTMHAIYTTRKALANPKPLWCFAPSKFDLKNKRPDLKAKRNDGQFHHFFYHFPL